MGSLYFRQLLAGRDFAQRARGAAQMQNFVYLIGDCDPRGDSRECVIVDPAWAVDELVDLAEADGMKVVGALATHYHPDHVGGQIFGLSISGLADLMKRSPCKVHCHKLEAPGIKLVTGLSDSDFALHESGDRVRVGDVEIELLHTPGHTPGSLCFKLKSALVAGDTLFLQGCGRVDLPGGDVEEMYRTLSQRLATLPDDTVLYPGHNYGGASGAMGDVRRTNSYLKVPDIHAWKRLMGR